MASKFGCLYFFGIDISNIKNQHDNKLYDIFCKKTHRFCEKLTEIDDFGS